MRFGLLAAVTHRESLGCGARLIDSPEALTISSPRRLRHSTKLSGAAAGWGLRRCKIMRRCQLWMRCPLPCAPHVSFPARAGALAFS